MGGITQSRCFTLSLVSLYGPNPLQEIRATVYIESNLGQKILLTKPAVLFQTNSVQWQSHLFFDKFDSFYEALQNWVKKNYLLPM